MGVAGALSERERAVAYYASAAIVTAFGFLGLLSIGFPLLVLGVLLLALGPVRRRRDVLWPPVLGVVAFTGWFVAFAPFACEIDPGATTRCESILGLRVPGGMLVGLAGALAAGIGAALVLKGWIRRSGRVGT